MRGTLFANPTFVGRGVRQPTLISVRPLVAYDENRIFFNGVSMKWPYKDIVNCTFMEQYQVLLVLTDDYKIYVFTPQLEKITTLHNYDPKYIVGFQAVEALSALILIGTEQVEIFKVTVLSNVKRTKFLSSMRFNLRKEEHLVADPKDCLKWNRGYGYDLQEDLLYVWSPTDLHFFSLSQLQVRSKISGLGKKQNSLSSVLFSRQYKYTVTGMLSGEVRVWRLPTSPLYQHKEILLHSFSYHSREVQLIIRGSDHRTIITSSLDMYVCFLSLQTFEVLRAFNFSGQYSKIYLCEPTFAYAVKDNYLGQLNFGLNLQFITDLTGEPIAFDRSIHPSQKEGEQPRNYLEVTLNSNVGVELCLEELTAASEANKVGLRFHYPPLKSKNIVQILSCPFQPDRYFLMVEDGQIFGSKMEGTSGKIDLHCVLSRSLDREKHALNQMPSCIRFLQLVPPCIDTEIMERTVDREYSSSQEDRSRLRAELQLLAVGGTRGSVLFLSIKDLSTLYCRLSYHRQKILNIQEIWNPHQNCYWLVSVCEQKYLKFVSFQGGKGNCRRTVYLGQTYVGLRGLQQNLIIIQPKGVFQLSRFETAHEEPRIVLNREAIDHDDEILSIDYRKDLRLLLTSGKDGRIKVWTTAKILVYEIVADQQLQYVLWGANNDIILFSNNKLYCLRQILHLTQKDLIAVDEEFRQDFDIEFSTTISEYIRQCLIKQKSTVQSPKVIMHSEIVHRKQGNETLQAKRHVSQHISQHETPQKRVSPQGAQTHRRALKTEEDQNRGSSLFRVHRSVPKRNRNSPRVKTEESLKEEERLDNDLRALKRHEEELRSIRKATNEAVLPKLKPKNQDIFVNFMRDKLLNKRLLTRRDITLNRIIMKNIIKDHLGDFQKVSSFKLE